jgi:hypothetical protein
VGFKVGAKTENYHFERILIQILPFDMILVKMAASNLIFHHGIEVNFKRNLLNF